LALAALLAAALMSPFPHLRPLAKLLSIGTLGSIAGTLAFQALALPVLWVIAFILAIGFHGETHLTNPFAVAIFLGGVVLMVGIFGLASLYGFLFGWRAAAHGVASGQGLKALIAADPVGSRLVKHRRPLLAGLVLVVALAGTLALRAWLL